MKKLLLITATFIFTALSLQAQRGYSEFENEEGMKVMYRWHRLSVFNKDSDAVLNLRVTNERETAVKWTFTVGFYEGQQLVYESEENTLCFRAGQSRRGGPAGLRFSLEGMKMEDVEKEAFSWDFGIFDVDEVDDCN